MDLQTIIFIGRSGAGKGTQAKILQDFLKEQSSETSVLYIETGAHFRNFVKSDGYTPERSRKVNETGGRQPDFLAVWMWAGAFINQIKGGEHLVFDGFPRSAAEAKILDTAFPFYERKNPTVIFLNVSEGWAEERLRGRGRADDLKPEVVARRLAFFEKDVIPAIGYYRENSAYRFAEINGEQTPDEVFNDIKNSLGLK